MKVYCITSKNYTEYSLKTYEVNVSDTENVNDMKDDLYELSHDKNRYSEISLCDLCLPCPVKENLFTVEYIYGPKMP